MVFLGWLVGISWRSWQDGHVFSARAPETRLAWGNAISMVYQDSIQAKAKGMVWGFTAQNGTRVARSGAVDVGLQGGTKLLVGESVDEKVCAKDLGLLIVDPFSAI